MQFIWEPKDFTSEGGYWGLMASKGDELVIIGGRRATSLRDGHSWEYDSAEEMAEKFNDYNYVPVFSQVNPSVVIRKAEEKGFNHGHLK